MWFSVGKDRQEPYVIPVSVERGLFPSLWPNARPEAMQGGRIYALHTTHYGLAGVAAAVGA